MTGVLRIGFLPLVDAALLVGAREEGFAEQEGLSIDLVRDVSWANLRDRLSVGMLDAAHMLAPAAIAATLGLGHLRVPMAAPTMLNMNGNAITISTALFAEMTAAAEGDIADVDVAAAAFAQVAAARSARGDGPPVLASVFPFSMHSLLIAEFLRRAKLKLGEEIPLVVLPPQLMTASLANGQIDGFCAGAPWNALAVEKGLGAIVAFGLDLIADAPEKLLVFRAADVEERIGAALALTRAVLAAARWAGDSFGIFPKNHPAFADQIVALLGANPQGLVRGKALRDVLIEDISLGAPPDNLFQLMSYVLGGDRRANARALASGEDPDGDAETLDVLAALRKFSGARPDAEAFIEALDPLQPRLYSISSSPKARPGRVSLTVDAVRYRIGPRDRLGVASTFLGERVAPGEALKVYVQKAHGFSLPSDPNTSVIMVGPGTGVAPFRAFLQERQAMGARGANWLFFGHQRRRHDFFYESEFDAMRKSGSLTRLSLAWSRDGAEKFYVQDRMREVGPELWRWLAEGAHFYVCGDAKRMAKDVERAMVDIVAQWGARSTEEAVSFIAGLKKAGRYQADVY